MAEFIGAYRLPNSVFGTAGADVATDILFYRKYGQDAAEKIAQLQAQNPDVLTEARVMWDDYISGKYFKLPENKKFILGEEGKTESWRTDENGDKKKSTPSSTTIVWQTSPKRLNVFTAVALIGHCWTRLKPNRRAIKQATSCTKTDKRLCLTA